MRRREFLSLLSGAAAAWPLPAYAQQVAQTRRIGVLSGLAADHPQGQATIAAFLQGLQQLGWLTGATCGSTTAGAPAMPTTCAVRGGISCAHARCFGGHRRDERWAVSSGDQDYSNVFANVPDPVGSGFVESLSRPGGNATGFVQFEYNLSGKWLEFLKQIAPNMTNTAILWDPTILAGIWPVRGYTVRGAIARYGGSRDQRS